MLKPYVAGVRISTLDSIWGFFDMPIPEGKNFEADDPVIQTLKGKLNRQRLLLHPDKNGHPDASSTFKFLEQCHARLTSVFVRRARVESVHQRTRREEEELKEEQERRNREEEERKAKEEQFQSEEDEKARREELERERLEAMLRDKEARGVIFEQKRKGKASVPGAAAGTSPAKQHAGVDDQVTAQNSGPTYAPGNSHQPVGQLTIHLMGAKDLPSQGYFTQTNAFAKVRVGVQRAYSSALSGCNPKWGCSFTFDVLRVDTALRLQVYREGLLGLKEEELLGSTEIPFLDLEEWSGCTIGRVLESDDPKILESGHPMVIELKASLQWY
jgi:hypothetical protein